jgi:heat shock protein HslJ
MKWNIVIFLLAAGFLFACGGDDSPKRIEKSSSQSSKKQLKNDTASLDKLMEEARAAQKVPFEKEYWKLSHFIIDGKKMKASSGTLDATFKNGRLDGNSGCNRYFAAYMADTLQQSITIRGLASTKKGCQGSLAAFERRFQRMLKSAKKYEYSNNTLSIICDQGEINFLKSIK